MINYKHGMQLRVLKYVKSTKDAGLVFQKGNEVLTAYSDADWTGDKDVQVLCCVRT